MPDTFPIDGQPAGIAPVTCVPCGTPEGQPSATSSLLKSAPQAVVAAPGSEPGAACPSCDASVLLLEPVPQPCSVHGLLSPVICATGSPALTVCPCVTSGVTDSA